MAFSLSWGLGWGWGSWPSALLQSSAYPGGWGVVQGLKRAQHRNGIFFGLSFPTGSSKWSSVLNSRFLNLMRITCKFYFIFIGNGIIGRTTYISISAMNHKWNGTKPLFYKLYQSVDYTWANSQNKQQNQ